MSQHFNFFQQHRGEIDAQTIGAYLHYFDRHVLVMTKTLSTLGVATHLQGYHQGRSMQHLSIYLYSFESPYATEMLVTSRNSAFGGQRYYRGN